MTQLRRAPGPATPLHTPHPPVESDHRTPNKLQPRRGPERLSLSCRVSELAFAASLAPLRAPALANPRVRQSLVSFGLTTWTRSGQGDGSGPSNGG